MDDFYSSGFQNYTVLHLNADLIPTIRQRSPDGRILVRMYTSNWYSLDPAQWAEEIAAWANPRRDLNFELTWANEQNLDIEGHPQGASPSQFYPPITVYQDINRWNMTVIQRLRALVPWATLHYPAFASGHSDDQNNAGYVGLEICRPSIQAADIMDCHVYWDPDTGPLTTFSPRGGGQRFVLTRNLFPNKPIYISEAGDFALEDARTPDQYVQWILSLYNYDYVIGATFFIWDSDDANQVNIIQRNGALVNALKNATKDPPSNPPQVPVLTPPVITPIPPLPVPENGLTYVVQPGDTLSAIAKRYGVTLQVLVAFNKITDVRLIYVGQKLTIPGAVTPPGDGGPPVVVQPPSSRNNQGEKALTYVVERGDTLSAIARKFNVTVASLMVVNQITDPNQIRAGQRLTIPGTATVLSIMTAIGEETSRPSGNVGVLSIDEAPPTNAPPPPAVDVNTLLEGRRITYYVTRPGDTVDHLAKLFNVEPGLISKVNQVNQGAALDPGKKIVIPMQ